MNKIKLSIIIVNYKTPKLTIGCIDSIYRNTFDLNIEIIVVDNLSEDNSLELISSKFPSVKCIQMNYNAGFSRANNEGIKKSNGEFILFLNSDTIIYDDVLVKSIKKYEFLKKNFKVGLFACKLLNSNKTVQYSVFEDFPGIKNAIKGNPIHIKVCRVFKIKKKKKTLDNHMHSHFTKWLCGAFLLIEKEIVSFENEFFNPKFFMYSEDVEIAYRLSKKGYKHYFWSEKSIIHLGGESSKNENHKKTAQIIISSWLFILISKGKLIFEIYFFITKFNLLLDGILDKNYKNSSEYKKRKHLINFFKKKKATLNENNYLKYNA